MAEDGTGHANHCPHPTEWRGRFRDRAGKWHTVESCDGHRADLEAVQRITSRVDREASGRPFWT